MANNEITVFEAVNNERTELIQSVSIQNVVDCRRAAVDKLAQAFALLGEAGKLSAKAGGGGITLYDIEKAARFTRYSHLSDEKERDKIVVGFAKLMDKEIWSYLMTESNMISVMDAKAREKWRTELEEGTFPEVTIENIKSTFQSLNSSKLEIFERGVINVFKALSWDYKTNQPQKFGRKIILENVFDYGRWGFSFNHSYRRNQIVDLERVMSIMDGKPVPEYRSDIASKIEEFIHADRFSGEPFYDHFFAMKYYKKGTCHLTFLREDLVEKMNDILVKHYPEALPPAVR